ncbi:MAG: hypothetical protein AAGD38_02590 [Acidobacteriota bacterium]
MSDDSYDLRPEYSESELRDGVRGKYYDRYQQGSSLVLLDPDVAKAFPDARQVNEALRMLMQVAKTATDST